MKCNEARAAILGADPSVLEGIGGDPLALHLRTCLPCASRARAILEGEGALLRGLTAVAPALDPDEILAAADARGWEGEPPLQRGRWRWIGHRKGLTTLLPLAAAAAAAAVFLAQPPALPGPAFTPPVGNGGLDVQPQGGNGLAVLETNDPAITVLWLF